MLLLRMLFSMQAAQKTTLPDSPTSPAQSGPTWSDYTKLYNDIMSVAFFMDPQSKRVAQGRLETKERIAQLSDRLQKETDEDFIQLTQKKLDTAKNDLEQLTDEFDGGHVGDIHSRFNQFTSLFDGPQLYPDLN